MWDFEKFKDRQFFGSIREDLFESYVNRFIKESKTKTKCSLEKIAYLNQVERGDFILYVDKTLPDSGHPKGEQKINFNWEVDVKSSNFISLRSILRFTGQSFVCIKTKDLNESLVVGSYSLQCYVNKVLETLSFNALNKRDDISYEQMEEANKHGIVWMSSGDPGFRVKPKFRNSMSLSNCLSYLLDDINGAYGNFPLNFEYKNPFKI